MEPHSNVVFDEHSSNTPLLMEPVLKLASKYQMEELRKRIVFRVEADWPQSISEWHRFDTTPMPKAPSDATYTCPRSKTLILEPVSAIRLARTYNIPAILPAAFYHLSRLSIERSWNACCGSHAKLEAISDIRYKIGARWELATGDDFRCLLHGRRALETAAVHFCTDLQILSERYLEEIDKARSHDNRCRDVLNDMASVKYREKALAEPDIFRMSRTLREDIQSKLCRHCSLALLHLNGGPFAVAERGLWDGLYMFFNL